MAQSLFTTLMPAIEKLKRSGKEQLSKLTRREQAMVAAGAIFLLGMIGYWIIAPINEAFATIDKEYNDSLVRARATSGALERYLKLKSRRDLIEGKYREVEFKEGALSHLENLIRNKAGVPTGFTIKDSPPRPFGGSYEQLTISIRFSTTNVPALVDFLKELVHGPRPLILSRLDISRPRIGGRLDVDMDVSSLRRLDGGAAPSK